MLRVISQEKAHEQAWQAYLQGAGKKNESFAAYAKRVGAENRTPPPAAVSEQERRAAVDGVRRKLGRLYRPPNIEA